MHQIFALCCIVILSKRIVTPHYKLLYNANDIPYNTIYNIFLTQTPNCLLWCGILVFFSYCILKLSEIRSSKANKIKSNFLKHLRTRRYSTHHSLTTIPDKNPVKHLQMMFESEHYQQLPSSFLDFLHFGLRQTLHITEGTACGHLDPFYSTNSHWLQLFDICHVLWSVHKEYNRLS